MRFRRRRSRRVRGEYPPSFTHAWIRRTLPTASPAEARALLDTMRRRGWTEAEVAERIMPYMPPGPPAPSGGEARAGEARAGAARAGAARTGAAPAVSVPARVSTAWLDRHLPAMDREAIGLVVEELERRGWPATELAVTVLPHLLPKLSPADANAILAGLGALGMTAEEIARLAPAAGPP